MSLYSSSIRTYNYSYIPPAHPLLFSLLYRHKCSTIHFIKPIVDKCVHNINFIHRYADVSGACYINFHFHVPAHIYVCLRDQTLDSSDEDSGNQDSGDDSGDEDSGDQDSGEDSGDEDSGDEDSGDQDSGSDSGDEDSGDEDSGDQDSGSDSLGRYIGHMNNSLVKKEIMKRKRKERKKVTEPGYELKTDV